MTNNSDNLRGLELLSKAWGLPFSALKKAMTSDKDDDARCGGPLGGRESEDAGHYVDRSIDRFAE